MVGYGRHINLGCMSNPPCKPWRDFPATLVWWINKPIGPMYGIFTYIYYKNQPIHVGKYTIHGSYGKESEVAAVAAQFHSEDGPVGARWVFSWTQVSRCSSYVRMCGRCPLPSVTNLGIAMMITCNQYHELWRWYLSTTRCASARSK